MRLVIEDGNVRYITAEEDEANDPEIQELEAQLVSLKEREVERKERQDQIELERWKWQELFDRQLVIDLKEERWKQRQAGAEQDRDEMRYLAAQLESSQADDRVKRLMAQKWERETQRKRESVIIDRRGNLGYLSEKAHGMATMRRDKKEAEQKAFETKQQAIEQRRMDAAFTWQTTAVDVVLKAERNGRNAIEVGEINAHSALQMAMKQAELSIQRSDITAKVKREEEERLTLLASTEQSRLNWDLKVVSLRKSRQKEEVLKAREFHAKMLSEYDRLAAALDEESTATPVLDANTSVGSVS
eukprot:TRINITY_DN32245_c0_g1_i1.p1 TRINITY_DN32245_c0_g1~~TRINITY_DN32245_c0_g1_i1.p1  ORF type:complete len:302 (+),score=146.04 TRINITY_DN32245_c0_g1_i1:54-959(+)